MVDFPKLTAREAETLLLQRGFVLVRQNGSHRIYKKEGLRMVVPYHAGKVLHPKIIKDLFNVLERARFL